MTDLPVWLQEIRDRVDKATEGPWYVMEDDDDLCMCMVGVAKDPMNSYGNYGNTIAITLLQAPRVADVDDARWDENADFIAHSRTDVPRLVELVGEMAWNLRNVTDQVQDACRSRMTPLSQCPEPSDDYCPTCPTGLRGECGAPRSLEALRKFRGEVSSND